MDVITYPCPYPYAGLTIAIITKEAFSLAGDHAI